MSDIITLRNKNTGEVVKLRRKSQGTEQEPTIREPNILQQLMGSTERTVGGIVGGIIEPPIKVIGRGGQAMESLISGQPPQNYTIPMPGYMGGDIPIEPAQNVGQLMGPVVGSTLTMLGVKGIMNPKSLTKVVKYDNVLTQARKSKVAIDETRGILGKAKEIALQDAKDLPTQFDWSKTPQNVIKAIQRPEYGVEFTQDGKVVNTIGNLDKVKTALQDIPSTKDFVEAGNMAKRQIMQFAGKIRDAMVSAANKAGKPDLAKSLGKYHDFMEKYEVINSHLVDKFGNALGNKMKSVFRWTSEPLLKESWKEVGKMNPEIKSIIKSREARELLKGLLKIGPPTAIGASAIGAGVGKLID